MANGMSEYKLNIWNCTEFVGDASPFRLDSVSDIDLENCAPVTLGATAKQHTISISENTADLALSDQNIRGQIFLTEDIYFSGKRFPTGSRIVADHVLITDDNPSITLVIARIIEADDTGENRHARVVISNSTLQPNQVFSFTRGGYTSRHGQGQNCFARGTMIDTPHGAIAIEQLEDGDEVMARDGNTQLISWIGKRRLSGLELALIPHLQPVRIMAGALTGGRPGQDLTISQNHRLLVDDWRAAYLFGEDEILVPAKSLLNNKNVVIESPTSGVEYFHLLMDGHRLICANGLWAETMLPGQEAQQMLFPEQREEIQRIQAHVSLNSTPETRSVVPALPHQSKASFAA